MRIGEVAKVAGVSVETVRFYERKGLIEQPPKPVGGTGFRSYPERTVEQIGFIRQSKEIGFSLRQARELLSLRINPDADCADVREHTAEKLEEVKRKIACLREIKKSLEVLINDCPGEGALGSCSIIAALTKDVTRKVVDTN